MSRIENTGIWLLKLEPFCEWRDRDTVEEGGHVFCCYGIPGAGKTVTWYEVQFHSFTIESKGG